MLTEQEKELIVLYNDLPKKQCKNCLNVLPMHTIFFRKEKRIQDGYENKCRKCRDGKFLTRNNKRVPMVDPNIKNNFNSIEDVYENFIKTNSLPYQSFIIDNHIYIFKYLIKKEKIRLNDLNKLNRKWFKDRKLYSSLLRFYKGRIVDYVNAAFPNLFKPWEFSTVGNTYWKNKENRLNALRWLTDKLLQDKVINSIVDIPEKVDGNTFKEYNIHSLLLIYYNGHAYFAFNELYPNKFYPWQYQTVIKDYYNSKENRIKSFKELINYLNIEVKNIPKIFSYEYFNIMQHTHRFYAKFLYMIQDYYNSDVYKYINDAYPNTFNKSEFAYQNHYPTLDNIIVRSEPERIIHHYFINEGFNFRYGDNIGRINIDGVNVIPDWYIYKNNIIYIIEYYGMLDMNDIDFGYKDKYEIKTKIYNKLCSENKNYKYIPLYRNDLDNGLNGIKDKLKEHSLL